MNNQQQELNEKVHNHAKIESLPAYDPADYLKSEEAIAAFLNDFLEEGNPALIAEALGVAARARGMTEIANKSGIARESLYKALKADSQPRLDTILKVMNAFGVRLIAQPINKVHDNPV
jgi:probable addiction module antidote protein